jgi:hypothetical protein
MNRSVRETYLMLYNVDGRYSLRSALDGPQFTTSIAHRGRLIAGWPRDAHCVIGDVIRLDLNERQ